MTQAAVHNFATHLSLGSLLQSVAVGSGAEDSNRREVSP